MCCELYAADYSFGFHAFQFSHNKLLMLDLA